jgi:hypothetical protein
VDERVLVLFYLDPPPKEVPAGWLEHQLAKARVKLSELTLSGKRADITGVWGGMPCRGFHDLGPGDGALFLFLDPTDVAAAMAAPPEGPEDLPPPLNALAGLCTGVRPKSALLSAKPVDEPTARRWAAEITAASNDFEIPAIFRSDAWVGYFLSDLSTMLLSEDLAPTQPVEHLALDGGDLYLRV